MHCFIYNSYDLISIISHTQSHTHTYVYIYIFFGEAHAIVNKISIFWSSGQLGARDPKDRKGYGCYMSACSEKTGIFPRTKRPYIS